MAESCRSQISLLYYIYVEKSMRFVEILQMKLQFSENSQK